LAGAFTPDIVGAGIGAIRGQKVEGPRLSNPHSTRLPDARAWRLSADPQREVVQKVTIGVTAAHSDALNNSAVHPRAGSFPCSPSRSRVVWHPCQHGPDTNVRSPATLAAKPRLFGHPIDGQYRHS
jgi:hypothetical protein